MTSEIQVLRWDKHKNCGEVKPVKIIDLSCTGMVLYIIMWQKIGTVILLYNRKVMTIPNEIFILNDPPYIDNYKQNISVVICDTNYPLWWWWFKSNSCLAPRTLIMNIVTPYIQCLCRRVVPSLQSDIGPTSVNGRLWRWFDVECQRWPVVILLIGSTLARLIGSTLARRYNVLFPMVSRPISNVQILCIGRQDVCPDGMFDRCGPTSNQYNPTSFLYNYKANHHLICNI